jgi:multidrug efflux pump subunit AcrA (membrane-fusion protein)
MCPPVLAVAATAVTAAGQVLNGIGQSQQYRYQAQVDDQNSRLAADQARDSIDNTNLEAQRRYRQLADTQGRQQAAMAANGVDLNFGSPTDVQRDTAMIGGEDIGQIYKAGYQRTRGFDIDGWNSRSQAAANRARASGALMQGIFSGLGTALGGASHVNWGGGKSIANKS